MPELVPLIEAEIVRPALVPSVADILRILVDPPVRRRPARREVCEVAHVGYHRRRNYLLQEARNSALGLAGELFVVNFERARLSASDAVRLADRVEHVSATFGDHEGFDVLSFGSDGQDRLIEVKTTGFGAYTPFFVTPNELEVSSAIGRDTTSTVCSRSTTTRGCSRWRGRSTRHAVWRHRSMSPASRDRT